MNSTLSLTNIIVVSFLLSLSSCASGIIYTDVVRPFCTDLRGTTLGTKIERGGSHRVDIPTTRIDITAEWNSSAIGDIAKRNGISTVYSCDLRTLSVLSGLYRKEEIIVYGD